MRKDLVYDSRILPCVLEKLRTVKIGDQRFILPHLIHVKRSEQKSKPIVGFTIKPSTHVNLVRRDLESARFINRANLQQAFEQACDERNQHVPFEREHLMFLKCRSRSSLGHTGVSLIGRSIVRVSIASYYELINADNYPSLSDAIECAVARRALLLSNPAWLMDVVEPCADSLNYMGKSF